MNNTSLEYLGFTIGAIKIAVAVPLVQEVFETTVVTRVPGCPDFIAGMVNVRGGIVPVLSLLAGAPDGRSTAKIVVLQTAEGQVGLLVSTVVDLLRFETIAPTVILPPELAAWSTCFDAMAGHDGIYLLLNVSQLIAGTLSRTAEAIATT